jgi:hypothetical protein
MRAPHQNRPELSFSDLLEKSRRLRKDTERIMAELEAMEEKIEESVFRPAPKPTREKGKLVEA